MQTLFVASNSFNFICRQAGFYAQFFAKIVYPLIPVNAGSGLQKQIIEIRSSAWLEHYTDNVGVPSSNLGGSTAATEALAKVA
jgi:hypothetical protein